MILERSQGLTKPNIQHKQLALTSVRAAVNKAGTRTWAAEAAPAVTFDSAEVLRSQPEGGFLPEKYKKVWSHLKVDTVFSAWSSREEDRKRRNQM